VSANAQRSEKNSTLLTIIDSQERGKMRSLLNVFAVKLASIVGGVQRKLNSEGAAQTLDVVEKIANAFMLLLQMVWYRIPNDSKVDLFITTYESLVQDALTLLSKFSFNDIVQSYRAKYTNLYTAKGGKRTYNLNFTTCKAFIQDALAGKTTIAKHVITRQVKQVKTTAPVSNSLLLSIANKLAVDNKPQPQVAVKQSIAQLVKDNPTLVAVLKGKPQVAESKVESKIVVPGFFTDLPNTATIEDDAFVRITLTDGSKVFGRWSRIVSPKYEVAVINKQGNCLAMLRKDVVAIATYTKAVRS
jgi:hypothetical protein